MLNIFLILLVLFVSLTTLLWFGSFFFQGYIYTQPSQQLYWQAPAAALLLTAGLGIWCLTIALSPKASKQNIPYDTLLNFTAKENMFDRPPTFIWAIKLDRQKTSEANKDGEKIQYKSMRLDQTQFQYKTLDGRPWQRQGVIAIEFEKDGQMMRFDKVEAQSGEYPTFVSADGWIWPELEGGPVDAPMKFFAGRLVLNLVFNFGHLLLWFLGFWLLLRFQWSHALGFAVVMWLVFTFLVVPIMLSYAGEVAAANRTPTAGIWQRLFCV